MTSDRDVKREYRTDEIAVIWEPERCIHTGNCIRGLPAVFNPQDRPWIHIDQATADELARVIETCPTGALHYERLDGKPAEAAPEPTTVTVSPNGPLFLRGNIELRDAAGNLFRKDTRMALCRCGHSANKPFCDNSHRAAGFRDAGRSTPVIQPTGQA
jgi:uncharacterized Fe-S cluster protein YjdI/CDGSH-type Zn-finger protein